MTFKFVHSKIYLHSTGTYVYFIMRNNKFKLNLKPKYNILRTFKKSSNDHNTNCKQVDDCKYFIEY